MPVTVTVTVNLFPMQDSGAFQASFIVSVAGALVFAVIDDVAFQTSWTNHPLPHVAGWSEATATVWLTFTCRVLLLLILNVEVEVSFGSRF